MDLVVDKVSEDSFYINLLLGLPKQLDKFKRFGIKTRHLMRKVPIPHSEICNWEHKQGILLPEDLRNFYNSTDGFLFTWMFNFGQDKTPIMGKIEINQLQDLTQIFGYETRQDPGVNTETENFELRLGLSSKLFELVKLDNKYKVVLVYLNSRYSPTIWVSAGTQEFYFLADDFITYFRMAVAHLGIPKWQLLFTPQGVPQWTENMIRLLAPHLLKTKHVQRFKDKRLTTGEYCFVPTNKLDLTIFKCLPKITQSIPRVVEKEKIQTIVKSPRKKRIERERSFTKIQRKPVFSSKKS